MVSLEDISKHLCKKSVPTRRRWEAAKWWLLLALKCLCMDLQIITFGSMLPVILIDNRRTFLVVCPLLSLSRRRACHVSLTYYCLTKISMRAKRSISRVFSLFIVPSPFSVHCPYKGRINRAESVLTGLNPYQSWFLASVTAFKNGEKTWNFSQALWSGITSGLGLCIRPYRYASQLERR